MIHSAGVIRGRNAMSARWTLIHHSQAKAARSPETTESTASAWDRIVSLIGIDQEVADGRPKKKVKGWGLDVFVASFVSDFVHLPILTFDPFFEIRLPPFVSRSPACSASSLSL